MIQENFTKNLINEKGDNLKIYQSQALITDFDTSALMQSTDIVQRFNEQGPTNINLT